MSDEIEQAITETLEPQFESRPQMLYIFIGPGLTGTYKTNLMALFGILWCLAGGKVKSNFRLYHRNASLLDIVDFLDLKAQIADSGDTMVLLDEPSSWGMDSHGASNTEIQKALGKVIKQHRKRGFHLVMADARMKDVQRRNRVLRAIQYVPSNFNQAINPDNPRRVEFTQINYVTEKTKRIPYPFLAMQLVWDKFDSWETVDFDEDQTIEALRQRRLDNRVRPEIDWQKKLEEIRGGITHVGDPAQATL